MYFRPHSFRSCVSSTINADLFWLIAFSIELKAIFFIEGIFCLFINMDYSFDVGYCAVKYYSFYPCHGQIIDIIQD